MSLALRLERDPEFLNPQQEELFASLLHDVRIDPHAIESAGWTLLHKAGRLPDPASDPATAAHWLESDGLALALLQASHAGNLEVERLLTAVRRWLLLEGQASAFPRASAALIGQAAHNGGAWPFGPDERAVLYGSPLEIAYLPPRPFGEARPFAAAVTRAVAAQYEAWPFPIWQRITRDGRDTIAARLAALGPDVRRPPDDAEILVAGCGTGREAAIWAHRAPHARITAIDLSATALGFAEDRCREGGFSNIEFRLLDLHEVASLGRHFDLISCCGVLHHLPDPEAGWDALAAVLVPGGTMRVMVYSKVARLAIQGAKHRIRDLLGRPVDADILREARARLMADPPHGVTRARDFRDLGGVHDMLFHAHEDSFDIPRLCRAVDRLGLDFLSFNLPSAADKKRYHAEHPDDPWRRDTVAWAALERRDPLLFLGMYGLWCGKPA